VQAHQAALKLAEHYNGFEVLVATHCDAEHIHSHLIINSVSFTDGKKLRQNPHTLEGLRLISDDICREMGLTTLERRERIHELEEPVQRLVRARHEQKGQGCAERKSPAWGTHRTRPIRLEQGLPWTRKPH